MVKWIKTCQRFRNIRLTINDGDESIKSCKIILEELIHCCDELEKDNDTEWPFQDSFAGLKLDLEECFECLDDEDGYDVFEAEVNYFLNEFYELCDCARVWLPL